MASRRSRSPSLISYGNMPSTYNPPDSDSDEDPDYVPPDREGDVQRILGQYFYRPSTAARPIPTKEEAFHKYLDYQVSAVGGCPTGEEPDHRDWEESLLATRDEQDIASEALDQLTLGNEPPVVNTITVEDIRRQIKKQKQAVAHAKAELQYSKDKDAARRTLKYEKDILREIENDVDLYKKHLDEKRDAQKLSQRQPFRPDQYPLLSDYKSGPPVERERRRPVPIRTSTPIPSAEERRPPSARSSSDRQAPSPIPIRLSPSPPPTQPTQRRDSNDDYDCDYYREQLRLQYEKQRQVAAEAPPPVKKKRVYTDSQKERNRVRRRIRENEKRLQKAREQGLLEEELLPVLACSSRTTATATAPSPGPTPTKVVKTICLDDDGRDNETWAQERYRQTVAPVPIPLPIPVPGPSTTAATAAPPEKKKRIRKPLTDDQKKRYAARRKAKTERDKAENLERRHTMLHVYGPLNYHEMEPVYDDFADVDDEDIIIIREGDDDEHCETSFNADRLKGMY